MTRSTSLLFGALSIFAATASAACSREDLLAAAKTYITAQTTGKIDGMKLATDNFTYQENNKAADIKRGVLSMALNVNFSRSTADTTACASYTNIIALTPKPYVLATQIRHANNDPSVISMVDTIAATTGSLFFNPSKTLGYVQAQDWSVQKDNLPSRELLKKYGDGYLDMWTDKNAADSMQWGADCERVEGSSFTKPCGKSLPHGGSAKNNDMRRYVIDEQIGSVDVLCRFSSLGNYADSHEIRVVDGKVKVSVSVTYSRGCFSPLVQAFYSDGGTPADVPSKVRAHSNYDQGWMMELAFCERQGGDRRSGRPLEEAVS